MPVIYTQDKIGSALPIYRFVNAITKSSTEVSPRHSFQERQDMTEAPNFDIPPTLSSKRISVLSEEGEDEVRRIALLNISRSSNLTFFLHSHVLWLATLRLLFSLASVSRNTMKRPVSLKPRTLYPLRDVTRPVSGVSWKGRPLPTQPYEQSPRRRTSLSVKDQPGRSCCNQEQFISAGHLLV